MPVLKLACPPAGSCARRYERPQPGKPRHDAAQKVAAQTKKTARRIFYGLPLGVFFQQIIEGSTAKRLVRCHLNCQDFQGALAISAE